MAPGRIRRILAIHVQNFAHKVHGGHTHILKGVTTAGIQVARGAGMQRTLCGIDLGRVAPFIGHREGDIQRQHQIQRSGLSHSIGRQLNPRQPYQPNESRGEGSRGLHPYFFTPPGEADIPFRRMVDVLVGIVAKGCAVILSIYRGHDGQCIRLKAIESQRFLGRPFHPFLHLIHAGVLTAKVRRRRHSRRIHGTA